jgi:hypothetical protein
MRALCAPACAGRGGRAWCRTAGRSEAARLHSPLITHAPPMSQWSKRGSQTPLTTDYARTSDVSVGVNAQVSTYLRRPPDHVNAGTPMKTVMRVRPR